MKPLRLGEIVELEIVEITDDSYYIVSISGQLLRTRHEFQSEVEVGDHLYVKVIAVKPLKFQVLKDDDSGFDRVI